MSDLKKFNLTIKNIVDGADGNLNTDQISNCFWIEFSEFRRQFKEVKTLKNLSGDDTGSTETTVAEFLPLQFYTYCQNTYVSPENNLEEKKPEEIHNYTPIDSPVYREDGKTLFLKNKVIYVTKSNGEKETILVKNGTIYDSNNLNITEEGQTVVIELYYSSGDYIRVKSDMPNFGYPKILYQDNSKTTQAVEEFISDGNQNMWICENKAGEYATDFKKWTIELYKVVFNSKGIIDLKSVDNNRIASKVYDGGVVTLAGATFNTHVDNNEIGLVLARNENLIRLKNFEKVRDEFSDIINEDLIKNPSEKSCYFYVVKASYKSKSINLMLHERDGWDWWSGDSRPVSYYYGSTFGDKSLSSNYIPSRHGYNFDGYYMDKDSPVAPTDDPTLHNNSEYAKVTDNKGNWKGNVNNFTGETQFLYIQYWELYAGWKQRITKITLDWNFTAAGQKEVEDGSYNYNANKQNTIYQTYNETCYNIVNSHGVKIPKRRVLDDSGNPVKNSDGEYQYFEFLGFYDKPTGGTKLIKSDGTFRRDITNYTSVKKWVYDNKSSESGTNYDCSLTLYARWSTEIYVELHKMGGTGGSDSFVQEKGAFFPDLRIPEKEYEDLPGDYWNFRGYYTLDENDNYKTQITNRNGWFYWVNNGICNIWGRSVLTKSIDLYAKWDGDKYRIRTESSNTDMGETAGGGRYKYGTEITLTATVEDPKKYVFRGWKKEGDSHNADYRSKEQSWKVTVTGNQKYYGYFGFKLYNIIYKECGGGDFDLSNFISTYPEKFNAFEKVSLINPQKIGYEFSGWFKDSAGTQPIYEIPEGTTNDVTVYAKWNKLTHEVYLNSNSGLLHSGKFSDGSTQKIKYIGFGLPVYQLEQEYIPTPNKPGSTFLGFYDPYGLQVINSEGNWICGTPYIDNDGNSLISDTLVLMARYNETTYINGIADTSSITLEVVGDIEQMNVVDNKVSSINWLNSCLGEPEKVLWQEAQKNFFRNSVFTNNPNLEYKSQQLLPYNYIQYNFGLNDTEGKKCIKQNALVDWYNGVNKNSFDLYIKNINIDYSNNQTILKLGLGDKGYIYYPGIYGYYVYITLNDRIDITYKLCIKMPVIINYMTVKYHDVIIPGFIDKIEKINITSVPCYAINNKTTGEKTFYLPELKISKYVPDLNYLQITSNSILNNVEIGTYDSDLLTNKPINPEDNPSIH
jgi:uncharacterized repeat protein (TIGR02543 family)